MGLHWQRRGCPSSLWQLSLFVRLVGDGRQKGMCKEEHKPDTAPWSPGLATLVPMPFLGHSLLPMCPRGCLPTPEGSGQCPRGVSSSCPPGGATGPGSWAGILPTATHQSTWGPVGPSCTAGDLQKTQGRSEGLELISGTRGPLPFSHMAPQLLGPTIVDRERTRSWCFYTSERQVYKGLSKSHAGPAHVGWQA